MNTYTRIMYIIYKYNYLKITIVNQKNDYMNFVEKKCNYLKKIVK